jgi:hypothetical protein
VVPGEPLQTSFGADLYDAIFVKGEAGPTAALNAPSGQPDKQVLASCLRKG